MPTRDAEHTVRILKFLASPEQLKQGSNAMAIRAELGIPCILLRGILRRLTTAGIIHSKRGRAGGVTLEAKALTLSILEVLDAVGPGKRRSQLWEPGATETAGDTVRALFLNTHAKAREVLAGTTVAQLN